MALSIYDILKLKESSYEKGIVEMFIRETDLFKVLPFDDVDSMSVMTRRMSSLPSVTWRARGQRFSDGGQPSFEIVQDSLYNLGAEVNIDDADMRDKGPWIVNPVQFNTEAKVKAMIYDFHDKFINGDHASDVNAFEGLKKRIASLASGQTLYGSSEVDVRPSAVTAATAYTWLNRIEEAKDAIDGHKADVCFTDRDVIRALKNALRVIGQYVNEPGMPTSSYAERETSNEPYTGEPFKWDGCSFIDMGVKADQSTKIVATETINNATRPMYFARLGGNNLSVIQYGPLDVTEPALIDDKVTYRGVISWYLGLRHVHNKFACKLSGSRVA